MKKILAAGAVLLLPALAFAQSSGINATYIQGYEASIVGIVNTILVPLLVAVAFIVFLWGAFNYFILSADNDEKRKEGRTFILYGIIGFVIIFSVWGLVNLVTGTLNLGANNVPAFPTLGTPTGGSTIPTSGTTGVITTSTGVAAPAGSITGAVGSTPPAGYYQSGTVNGQPNGQPIYSPIGSGGNSGTVGQGGSCENDAQACSSGYVCQVNSNGNDTCVAAASATGQIACDTGSVPAGTQCAKCSNGQTADSGADCPAGSSAVVPQDNSLGAGGDCEENINACQSGLICQQNTNGDDTCVSPNSTPGDATLGAGGDCEQNANACSPGYVCQANSNGDDTCVASGSATGQTSCDVGSVPAGSLCAKCSDGSTADSGADCPGGSSAVVPQNGTVGVGGDCEENASACQSGLTCQPNANGDDTCVSSASATGQSCDVGSVPAGQSCVPCSDGSTADTASDCPASSN